MKSKSKNEDLKQLYGLDSQRIYVYRYIWKEKDNPNLCIKVVSGLLVEHEQFVNVIKSTSNITACSRVYLHEYDISKIEMYDTVVEDKEKQEKGGEE